jgi:hypothetical protein
MTNFDLVLISLHFLIPSADGISWRDGFALLETLHRNGTPVIMISGYYHMHLAVEAFDAGALDFILKDKELTFLSDLPKRVVDALAPIRPDIIIQSPSDALSHPGKSIPSFADGPQEPGDDRLDCPRGYKAYLEFGAGFGYD